MILRIVIPFICIFVAIGYIFLPMSIMWQFIASLACTIIYIVKGSFLVTYLIRENFKHVCNEKSNQDDLKNCC